MPIKLARADAINASPRASAQETLAVHPIAELPSLLPTLAHGRPLLVHVCATWCVACREEFKQLGPLFRSLESRGMSAALVWIDGEKTRGAIGKMTARYRLGELPALVLDAPDPEPVAKAFLERRWDGALPATFVYGVHQEKISAFLGSADPGLLRDAIDEALRRAKPAAPGKP